MKILVINGPNLNMLGVREPDIYGRETYAVLVERLEKYGDANDLKIEIYQSNHEGALVDRIQQAFFDRVDGIVFNPGAYTHTSVALLDALKAVRIPCVEVHISNPDTREEFRKVSYIRPACIATIAGHGTAGYFEAIDLLIKK